MERKYSMYGTSSVHCEVMNSYLRKFLINAAKCIHSNQYILDMKDNFVSV
jgi:hypothetical protein